LFVPEAWFSEAYRLRRSKCDFPAELAFRTKPQLAAEMLQNVVKDGLLPFKYVVADTVYGNSEDFLYIAS
ncbi:MAG: transposase, partial [Deltaproteobacteria bacterium]|nr:transposase [Deltaproteobacteria bacterium]